MLQPQAVSNASRPCSDMVFIRKFYSPDTPLSPAYMKIRITKLQPDIELPQYKTTGAVAFDLAAAQDTTVAPRQIALIPTGLVIATPRGYALIIASRSSTPMKKGFSPPHGIGIIDQDYAGPNDEIKIQVYNFTDTPIIVTKGERIAQAFFVPIARAEWDEGDPEEQSRGGFGSTGIN